MALFIAIGTRPADGMHCVHGWGGSAGLAQLSATLNAKTYWQTLEICDDYTQTLLAGKTEIYYFSLIWDGTRYYVVRGYSDCKNGFHLPFPISTILEDVAGAVGGLLDGLGNMLVPKP